MQQVKNYADSRLSGFCIYCHADPETREHVPSKVFLDRPYPENLPIVFACAGCNEGFSLDEAYLACLIECTLAGSTADEHLARAVVKRLLGDSSKLRTKLRSSQIETDVGTRFRIENRRVSRILVKLAQGHANYEVSEPVDEKPVNLSFAPLVSLTSEQVEIFETLPRMTVWPEVGSRQFFTSIESGSGVVPWVDVQSGRYRYLVMAGESIVVRIVLSEYLACEVVWE